jgi:hypothetical protein
MNARMAESPEFARVNRFGTHFFNVGFGTGLLIQTAFVAVSAQHRLMLRGRARW